MVSSMASWLLIQMMPWRGVECISVVAWRHLLVALFGVNGFSVAGLDNINCFPSKIIQRLH